MELTDKLAVSGRISKSTVFPSRGSLPFQAQRQFERLLALDKKFVVSTSRVSKSGDFPGQRKTAVSTSPGSI
jgi:hypothetical protein